MPLSRHRKRKKRKRTNEPDSLAVEATNREAPPRVKMSAVLSEFIGPYVPFAENESQRRTLFAAAGVAWNIALFPPDERAEVLAKAMEKLEPDGRDVFAKFINELIERKDNFFSQYGRRSIEQ